MLFVSSSESHISELLQPHTSRSPIPANYLSKVKADVPPKKKTLLVILVIISQVVTE